MYTNPVTPITAQHLKNPPQGHRDLRQIAFHFLTLAHEQISNKEILEAHRDQDKWEGKSHIKTMNLEERKDHFNSLQLVVSDSFEKLVHS